MNDDNMKSQAPIKNGFPAETKIVNKGYLYS